MPKERLQKLMARAGVASRRASEEIIAAGRVTVNGRVVTEMGIQVDPQKDQVRVDGTLLTPRARPKLTYLMLYKPPGYLSVFDDDRGRPGLEALVETGERLYPVGRLDLDSEGLLLLTNDGDLTLRLSHPRYQHRKTYLVLLKRPPSTETLAHFRQGIQLEDGMTAPSKWRVLEKPPTVPPAAEDVEDQGTWVHVTLREGRKRQIRRMAAAENLGVRRLIRVGMGPLGLDRKLKPGESRPLTRAELQQLRAATRPRRRPGSTAGRGRRASKPSRHGKPGSRQP
jgi:pseudouridine synthase